MSKMTHTGTIKTIVDQVAQVVIDDNLDCAACSIKGSCSVINSNKDILKINVDKTGFKTGEKVEIIMSSQMAFFALFWAYIFPFIILISGVIVLSFYVDEGIAGLISILILIIYYLMLFLYRKYFNKRFNLKIKHL